MNLKTLVLKAVFWVMAAGIITRLILFVTNILLYRFLTAYEVGILALVWLFLAFIGIFKEIGLSRALIYQREQIDEAANTALLLTGCLGIGLFLLTFPFALLIAQFYQDEHLTWPIRVLALNLVISSFSVVPFALLEKEIQFKKSVIPESVESLAYGVVGVSLAYIGFSYWGPILGQIVGALLSLVIVWYLCPWRPRFSFSWAMAKSLFSYGKEIVALNLINLGIRNLDDAFVGKVLDKQILGVYYFAYQIANLPATHITNVIGRILFPVYSQLSTSTFELRHAFLKTIGSVALLTIPLTFTILLFIPDLLFLCFGHKWDQAILPIRILSFFGLLRALGSGMGGIFLALGKPHIMRQISLFQLIFLALLLYPITRWAGIVGVSILVTFSILLSAVLHYMRLREIFEGIDKDVLNLFIPPSLLSVISGIFAIVLLRAFSIESALGRFSTEIVAMVILYSLGLFIIDSQIRKQAEKIVREFLIPAFQWLLKS
ncbi:MAG: lipopolysaccharide biosynthesis protein [Candidatus Tectomicrobia bacterium]|nr:lipopolysaccharide biosynthesis protein [Candidatus Tectomicrobia bacterium]